jgi:hypothetical protein
MTILLFDSFVKDARAGPGGCSYKRDGGDDWHDDRGPAPDRVEPLASGAGFVNFAHGHCNL